MLLVFLLLFPSVFTENKCLTSTELFNSLIVSLSSSPIGPTSFSVISQSPSDVELPLAKAQMLQQWVGKIAQQIVDEDGTFAGHYSCVAKKHMANVVLSVGLIQEMINSNLVLFEENFQKLENQKFNFLKMLFEFAALLSAETGKLSSSSESSLTRMFLTAYECVADKKFIENEKDFLPFAIFSKMKGKKEQLNIEKVLLKKKIEEDGRLQIRFSEDFTLLNALNIEMTASDVMEFVSFVHVMLSNTRNPFEKRFLAENGLTIENIGQDPVKHRRIAYQLLKHLRNWGQNDLKKKEIQWTMREKCIFGIFTRNLMRRMANFELLHEYFGEFKLAGLSGIVQEKQESFEKFSDKNCNISRDGIRMEAGRIYMHFDEAIQIEWNIWKEIIGKIDQINANINRKRKKDELGNYLESDEYKEGMRMIKAQFDEHQLDGLEFKVEKKKEFDIELEERSKEKIIGNLAKMRQMCEQNIAQYEREMPFKRKIVIKQKENYANFYKFMTLVAEFFGEKITVLIDFISILNYLFLWRFVYF